MNVLFFYENRDYKLLKNSFKDILYFFLLKITISFLRVLMAKVIMIILSILVNIFQIDISNIDKYGLLEIIFLKQL